MSDEHTHEYPETASYIEDPPPPNSFTELAGVPVRFDRLPAQGFPYGAPPGQERKFHCTPEFELKLRACFEDLWARCPFGKANLILSAGTWVNKPKMHGRGRAVDIDAIFWGPPARTVIAKLYQKTPRWYLAIEAVFRKHFGLVLNHHYDVHHVDHWHLDDSVPVRFDQDSRSECVFVQACLRDIFRIPVGISGTYSNPMREGLHKLNAGDLRKHDTYMKFLDRVTKSGFSLEV